jgi:hypothetical protein
MKRAAKVKRKTSLITNIPNLPLSIVTQYLSLKFIMSTLYQIHPTTTDKLKELLVKERTDQ